MVEVSYHEGVKVLQGAGFAATAPFDRPHWFGLLEQAGAQPLIALARDGDDALALPLRHDGNGLAALTNWYSFLWRPLATGDASLHRLLGPLLAALARRTPRLVLAPVPEEEGLAQSLAAALRRHGWAVFAGPCDTNRHLPAAGLDYGAYEAALPGQLRSTIRRKRKKLAVTIADRFDAADWDAYEAIYAASWKPEEGAPAMLRAFAQAEAAAGRMRLGLARHEGEPVAAQFWTVENGIAYIHKLAHRPDSERLSAGTVLTAALIERAIDTDGVREIDFGTGDDRYKRDWMRETRARWRIEAYPWRRPAAWPGLVRAAAGRLASTARRR